MKNIKFKLFKSWLVWGFFIIFVFLGFQFLLYRVESADPSSGINSFAKALWYGIVTLATVGYGDIVPVTTAGRILGSILVLSTIALMGLFISQFTNKIRQIMENKKLGYLGTNMQNHCVIIGWDSFALNVTEWIIESNKQVAIITEDRNDIDLIYNKFGDKKVFVLYSDYLNFDNYKLININKSSSVFINFEDDSNTLVKLLNIKRQFPDLNYIVSLNSSDLKDTFQSAGVTFSISKNEVASKLVASYNFEPDVASFTENIMSTAVAEDDHDLVEYKINGNNNLVNKNYIDAFISLKKDFNSVLMGISRKVDTEFKIIKNPKSDLKILEGDYLIVLADGRSKKLLSKEFGENEGRNEV